MDVLADDDVESALVVVAHPDDADFWAGGTVACWSAAGIVVTYLVLTDGDAGGFDSAVPRADIPRIRRSEQQVAARILGVRDIRFLGLTAGTIVQGIELRRQIVRVIRQVRPRRLLTWSPGWNWSRFRTSCHIDHRATGEVALTAAYPRRWSRGPTRRPSRGSIPRRTKQVRTAIRRRMAIRRDGRVRWCCGGAGTDR